jgi:hypothetical protein
MKKQIEYDITFTGYTIDTYQMFTSERDDEYIIDGYQEETGRDISYDDIDWTYDHKGYVKALAETWCDLMNENITDGVIKSVALKGEPWSPREYNFSTDNCVTLFTVNYEALRKYIADNLADYNKNKIASSSGFVWLGDKDDTMLHYYLHTVSHKLYSPEDAYIYDMFDRVSWYEYITTKLKETVSV